LNPKREGTMGKRRFFIAVLLAGGMILGLALGRAYAVTYFFLDDKLEMEGRIEQFTQFLIHVPKDEHEFSDTNIYMTKSSFKFDALYHIVDQPDLVINFYGGFKYWYESSIDIDKARYRQMDGFNRNIYRRPIWRDDDPILEAYVDIMKGPWQVLIGKQQVVWGETSLKQTADRVNPLDLRHETPGTTPFNELKIGLWMLRVFYATELPGEITLEGLFIPGDHQPIRTSVANSPKGSPSTLFAWYQKKWREEREAHSLSNYEYGFRVRGFWMNFLDTGLDWTLFYLNVLNDSPTIVDSKTWSRFLGLKVTETDNDAPRLPEKLRRPIVERWRNGAGLDYKRTEYVGGTAQYYWNWATMVIRGEFAYEIGKHYGHAGRDHPVKRDALGYGIAFDRPIMFRPLMRLTTMRKLNFTVQFFQDWIMNHSNALSVSGRGDGDKSRTTMTLALRQDFAKQTWTVTNNNLYDFSGTGYSTLGLSYGPGIHWKYAFGAVYRYKATSWTDDDANINHEKDYIYIRVRYEF
jgi:hypothetical protein